MDLSIKILTDWKLRYNNFFAEHIKDAETCISDFLNVCKNKHIYLWGANSHGKTLYGLLKDIGLTDFTFIDKNAQNIKQLNGINVYEPKWLTTIDSTSDCLFIAAANLKNQESIKRDINQLRINIQIHDGFSMHLPLQSSVCLIKSIKGRLKNENCSGCTQLNHTCSILRNNILQYKRGMVNKKGADITLIGCILGTICTLKCKHCVEHVPYITKETKILLPKEKIISDIEKLAEACRYVTVLDFVGGEPFLHPDLAEIIEKVSHIDNIGILNVFTNGTIVPDSKLLEQLSKDFVTVDLSNYSKNLTESQRNTILTTESALINAGVSFFQAKDFTWSDTCSFEHNNDEVQVLTQRFSKCILKDCYRLFDGKLFRCLHHYAGYVTGNLCEDESVINIREFTTDQLIEQLSNFIELPYINACSYCDLPYIAKSVPSGIQL